MTRVLVRGPLGTGGGAFVLEALLLLATAGSAALAAALVLARTERP